MAGIEEWRLQHPKAPPLEIEAVGDARLAEQRVCMLRAGARASAATDVSQESRADRPICPRCGSGGEPRGRREHPVTTPQSTTLRLTRNDVVCLTCQVGFSPLDEALALLPGQLTPRLQESVARLGTWMPLRQMAEAPAFFPGLTVSEATVRQTTAGAGRASEAVQNASVERIEGELSPTPTGPRVQMLSVDGALVPWRR